MVYEIRLEKSFIKRMDNMAKLFNLENAEAQEVRETIVDAIGLLSLGKSLPEDYADHKLEREPWYNYHEFHILDDLLVVYYRIDKKQRIRMVTITNHEELASGKLQN